MYKSIEELKKVEVFRYFIALSEISRPSRHEEKAKAWIRSLAEQWNREYKEDAYGNLVVLVPANTVELENSTCIAIQSHLDMVCEKDADHTIDFLQGALELELIMAPAENNTFHKTDMVASETQWVHAVGTTLGADNGIAVAMAIELMSRECSIIHGPLELLFTVEEEIGLIGAANLGADMIQAKYLINIDNSEEGFFCTGCAGGRDFTSTVPLATTIINNDIYSAYTLRLEGLSGGHSGMEIYDGRANALKIIEWLLSHMRENHTVYISSIEGGDKRNAIPRFAEAHCWIASSEEGAVRDTIESCMKSIMLELPEKDMQVHAQFCSDTDIKSRHVFSEISCDRILHLLRICPAGVLYRKGTNSLDSTMSNNLASIRTIDLVVQIVNSSRFLSVQAESYVNRLFKGIFADDDIHTVSEHAHAAWRPSTDSALLSFLIQEYQNIYKHAPVYAPVHAGIECAMLNAQVPQELDMVSFGPDIKYLHSPKERVDIASTLRVWDFIKQVLPKVARMV